MIQRRQRLRFTLETRDAIAVGRHGVGKDFQGDTATELRVARAIDFAHPARTNEREDFVDAKSRSGRERISLSE
jgi:hypothetical protein